MGQRFYPATTSISLPNSAIERALLRRGLSERYEIDVQIVGQYCLRRKAGAS